MCETKCVFGVITETWFDNSKSHDWELCDLNVNGFKLSSACRSKGRGGGLAIIYRDNCMVEKLNYSSNKCMELGLWKVTYHNINHTVLGIYRAPYSPSNKTTDNQFVDEFLNVLAELLPHHNNLVILGDIYLHLNQKDDPLIDVLDQSLSALGLKQHVSEYTHKDGNILDVIITELDNTYTHSCEVRDFLSDHRYVLFKSTRCKDKIEHHKVEHRNLKCATQSTWREKLSNISIIDNCCITEQAKAFENDLTKLLNEVALIENKIVRKRTPKPWFSDNVKATRLTYRRCVKSWEKSKSEDKWRAVKKSRHEYCKQLKHAKKSFFSEKVLSCYSAKGNVKGLYNTINGLIKREKENPMPTNRSNHDLAQHFADFFSNKVSNIAEALKQYLDFVPPESQVAKLESFDVVSDDEIISIMTKLGNKQCELDLFPVNILNEHKASIVKEITKLVNLSLQSGSFLRTGKKAVVKPLIKKPSAGPIDTNYRPVSNLKFLAKIVECAALKQIVHHCESNKLLPKFQSAYRKGLSCEAMLVKLADSILNGMELGNISAVLLMDLSAAFDTVNHSILLETFDKYYGINGQVSPSRRLWVSLLFYHVCSNTVLMHP